MALSLPMSRLALTLALLGLPALAHADLAPGPPQGCPRGAAPRVAPTLGYCEPTTCAADSDCESGQACSPDEIGLCVYEEAIPTERVHWAEQREVPTRTVRMVRERGCEPDNTCLNTESTCERARRCVAAPPPPAEPPPPPPATVGPAPAQAEGESPPAAETSGGCSVGASGSPALAGTLALAALLALATRRRRT